MSWEFPGIVGLGNRHKQWRIKRHKKTAKQKDTQFEAERSYSGLVWKDNRERRTIIQIVYIREMLRALHLI